MTHLRANSSLHGGMTRIKVSLEHDMFDAISRMAYQHNVPVSALVRQMVKRQIAAIKPALEAAE